MTASRRTNRNSRFGNEEVVVAFHDAVGRSGWVHPAARSSRSRFRRSGRRINYQSIIVPANPVGKSLTISRQASFITRAFRRLPGYPVVEPRNDCVQHQEQSYRTDQAH